MFPVKRLIAIKRKSDGQPITISQEQTAEAKM